MSTIRPTDREFTPVGWVQTSQTDPLQFTHQQTGLCIEAIRGVSTPRPGIEDCTGWTLRYRKPVGEMETTATIGHAVTKERATRLIVDGMQAYNRMRSYADSDGANSADDTIDIDTLARKLAAVCERGVGSDVHADADADATSDDADRRW